MQWILRIKISFHKLSKDGDKFQKLTERFNMARKVKVIPKGYNSVTTAIAVKDAVKALEFYKKVFGAKIMVKFVAPGNIIVHSELKIGDVTLMVSEEDPKFNHSPQSIGCSTVVLCHYVENVDKFMSKAEKAGAKILMPPSDQFYGDRACRIEDPFGHIWSIATHIEDVSPQEMQKRFKKLMKQG